LENIKRLRTYGHDEEILRNINWYVEPILCIRHKRRKTEYLIKWQGFDASFASWEPEENLSSGLLLAYRSKQINGKYRVSGSSTLTPSYIAARSTTSQLNGPYD
jgi:hypothetical protein